MMKFLKPAAGVKLDIRGERRICVKPQFSQTKRPCCIFGVFQKELANSPALMIGPHGEVFYQEMLPVRDNFNKSNSFAINFTQVNHVIDYGPFKVGRHQLWLAAN
jgi:hypothetical protein